MRKLNHRVGETCTVTFMRECYCSEVDMNPARVARVLNLSLRLSPPWTLGGNAPSSEDSLLHDVLLKSTVKFPGIHLEMEVISKF